MILTALVQNFTRPTFPFAAGSFALLLPHFHLLFALLASILSHFLRCYLFLRTPLPIRPIFARFSRGGAQIPSGLHYTHFAGFDKRNLMIF